MSLATLTSPLHAIGPHVWWEEDRLCARTSRFWQAVSLGSFRKEVEVDPGTRVVIVRTRSFWFANSELDVPFESISHIEYRYGGLITGWTMFGDATDGVESFSVALALHDRSEIHLFSFHGAGSHETGTLGVMLGDSLIDTRGDQQERSLSFLDGLMDLTGKGLSKFSKPRKYR